MNDWDSKYELSSGLLSSIFSRSHGASCAPALSMHSLANETFVGLVWLKVVDISDNNDKQIGGDSENVVTEEGLSSESVTNVCNSGGSHDYDDSSDTSLKLGLVKILH